MMETITEEKLEKYFQVTEDALALASESINPGRQEEADQIIDMASRYLSDAKHFSKKGDRVTAFAALNYAHGWLDSGASLGVFQVTDNTLFTVDGE